MIDLGQPVQARPITISALEFDVLWQRLATEHGYRVERMLQDLILTEAYGAP